MSIAYVQSASSVSSGFFTTETASYSSNCAVGNLLIAAVWYRPSAAADVTAVITDSAVQLGWTEAANCHNWDSGSGWGIRLFYLLDNGSATSLTITATFGGSCQNAELCVAEYSGVTASDALDQSGVASNTSTSPASTPSESTNYDGELCVGMAKINTGFTISASSPFTARESSTLSQAAYSDNIQSTKGSISASWTFGGSAVFWEAAIATFTGSVLGDVVTETSQYQVVIH